MLDRCGFWTRTAARTLFLVLVVVASFAYGLTRESTIHFFNWALGGTVALWMAGSLLSRRWPRTGLRPWLIALAILSLGWGVCALSVLGEWSERAGTDLPEFWSDVVLSFGAFDADLSVAAMVRTTVLLGGLLMTIDLFSQPNWARALFLTLTATVSAMVAFYFLQKIVGSPFLIRSVDGYTILSFATFRYWGNAASFLNLLWPLAAAVAIHFLRNKAHAWVLWMAAALFALAAAFLNISKAGNVLAAFGILLFLGIVVVQFLRSERRGSRLPPRNVLIAIALPAAIILASFYFAIPWGRWDALARTEIDVNARAVAYRYFMTMLPDAGWFGFGPGSFQLAYWHYVDPANEQMRHEPFWVAHEDYIQTIVEWGYAGAILWGLLLAIPAMRLGFSGLRSPVRSRADSAGYLFGIGDHLRAFFSTLPGPDEPIIHAAAFVSICLTALHALVDFPMQIESLQFYFLIWIALGWHALRRPEANPADRP